jgi:hypothetical protein
MIGGSALKDVGTSQRLSGHDRDDSSERNTRVGVTNPDPQRARHPHGEMRAPLEVGLLARGRELGNALQSRGVSDLFRIPWGGNWIMPSPEIEEFAKLLVREVRDASIRDCDVLLRPNAAGPTSKRWKEAAHDGNLESIVRIVVADTVDGTVFHLLDAIDNGLLNLSFTAANGKRVDLPTDGLTELAGWYLGDWRALYSRERFVDDAADLIGFFGPSKEGE